MCLFCDFILEKEKNHMNGFPFIKIQETDDILVFLAAPEKCAASTESDILVIPKQHFEFIEDVPKPIQDELIQKSSEIAGILRKKDGSSKILLNNGSFANQYIPHVHFHIIPINKEKQHALTNLSLEEHNNISTLFKELLTFKNS
jgi:diadenosine tetraphosphate (Ap4A) HIT family hydrolase